MRAVPASRRLGVALTIGAVLLVRLKPAAVTADSWLALAGHTFAEVPRLFFADDPDSCSP